MTPPDAVDNPSMADHDYPGRDPLYAALREALATQRVGNPDPPTLEILGFAARLAPEPGEPPEISTSRLFIGAMAYGGGAATGSYPRVLSEVTLGDEGFAASYREILALFKQMADEEAVSVLGRRGVWFSKNVGEILARASSGQGDLPLSDAIVREMLTYRPEDGLLYRRIDIPRLAEAVASRLARRATPRTLAEEIADLLKSVQIPVTPAISSVLLRATAHSGRGEELAVRPVLMALLVGDPDVPRSADAPSAMLAAALPPPVGVAPLRVSPDAPEDPDNPLRFSPALMDLLRRAFDKQQRCFLNRALGTKGLVAAVLTLPEQSQSELEALGFRFTGAIERFRDIVALRLPDGVDLQNQWASALEVAPESQLRKVDSDQPTAATRDQLGIENDAMAIAHVAAGPNTSLPLAFGIFGDWGAGKTFFMNLIRRRITGLTTSPVRDDGFEHAIVQIQFNAWHYAETNLWASLVSHIFEELDRWMTRGTNGDDPRKAIDTILKRLSTSRQLTLEAASELVQRRKEHTAAAERLANAQQDLVAAQDAAAHAPLTVWRSALAVARKQIADNPDLRQHLDSVEKRLGIPGLETDRTKLIAALDELNRSATAGRASLAALQGTIGNTGTVALALAALVGVPLVIFGTLQGLGSLSDQSFAGIGTLGGMLSSAAVLVGKFAGKAKALTAQFTELKVGVDKAITEATAQEQADIAEAQKHLAKTQSEVDKTKAVMQATGDQVAAALRDYAEETGTQRILRFVRARVGSDGYSKHLGLVSTIRRDFEQLEALMLPDVDNSLLRLEQARRQYHSRVEALITAAGTELNDAEIAQLRETAKGITDARPPEAMQFRRIILYIDDLDRCDPEKVIQVLQAVNMLLSFRLFVVMVAVDARWLSRSLEKRYPDFFGSVNGNGKSSEAVEPGDRATPADYLEKIFQIPYWVAPMTEGTSKALVGNLVNGDRVAEPVVATPITPPPGPASARTAEATPSPPPPEDEQSVSAAPPRHALGLTGDEIETLTSLSPFLGGSPRRARRFVNVYRVAKASLTPGEIKTLEDGEHRALATQLAIATGAPGAFSSWIDICETAKAEAVKDRVADLPIAEDERKNIIEALDVYRQLAAGDLTEAHTLLAEQGLRAARFTFAVPRREPPAAAPA